MHCARQFSVVSVRSANARGAWTWTAILFGPSPHCRRPWKSLPRCRLLTFRNACTNDASSPWSKGRHGYGPILEERFSTNLYCLPLLYQLSSVPLFERKRAGVFHHQPFTSRLPGTGGRTSTRSLAGRPTKIGVVFENHHALCPAKPKQRDSFIFRHQRIYAAPRSIRMMMRPTGNPSSQRRIGMFTSLWLLW
jgi:hypothetical protein